MSFASRLLTSTLASVVVLGASALSASADTYVERVTVSRYIACYDRVYVPAKVMVNTRGRLVKSAATGWETSATRWDRVRYPATYVETRRTVEPDHYTLRQRGC